MDKFNWRTGKTNPARQKKTGLSPREIQIILGLAQGKTRPQLALELGLSPHTIKSHLVRAYHFLGAVNSADAYRKMIGSFTQPPAIPASLVRTQAGDLPGGLRVYTEDGQLLVAFEVNLHIDQSG